MRTRQAFITAALTLLLTANPGPRAARADLAITLVTVNTSAIRGQSGFLDFQFNPGGLGAETAAVAVTNFTTAGGILTPSSILSGDASGVLPGTLRLDNGTAFNDVFQGFTFGSSFSFQETLSGPALDFPGGTFGSAFAVSLYAADGITPLLTVDPNGSVLTQNLDTSGALSNQTFAQSSTNSNPAAVATPIINTPEPSSMILLISSLPAAWLVFRRKRNKS